MVQELLQLAVGVKTFDSDAGKHFWLRTYLICGFGDYPAMSMALQMKGHNSIFPCRMCLIEGLRIPDSSATTHYVPLHRANHPDVVAGATRQKVQEYDPANLPLRTPAQFMKHAHLVQFAEDEATTEELGKACGIKGIPLLSCLPSLFIPTSFPFDFMHLIWENLIKNLVLLFTGAFKDLNHSDQDYLIQPSVWEAIGEATARLGSTIPSAYGARPQNIASDKTYCTADSWSFWTLYLSPVLLQRRFHNQDYYSHFVELVRLLNICLQFSITWSEVEEIRVGFQKWVLEYERYVARCSALQRCRCSSDCFGPVSPDSITSTTLIASPHALSPFTHSFTSPTESKRVVPFGHTGLFRWNATVAFWAVASRADAIPLPTLTLTAFRWLS